MTSKPDDETTEPSSSEVPAVVQPPADAPLGEPDPDATPAAEPYPAEGPQDDDPDKPKG